jgi:predicted N-formylglutamate amidohydrolase
MPGRSESPLPLVLSCEHGGNDVPKRWRALFEGSDEVLETHRGWDPGALVLAKALARALNAPLIATTVTRLLVEPNRSLGHPKLFSEYTRSLPELDRRTLVDAYWAPHRRRVEDAVKKAMGRSGRVLHVGVHSFTPVLDGEVREVDVGVLYDPAHGEERVFCQGWIRDLRAALRDLRVRANRPYRGSSDGLTTYLRRTLGERYLGVELEVGQGLLGKGTREGKRVADAVAATLAPKIA